MAGNLRIQGNQVFLDGYKPTEPTFRKPKVLRGKCKKCPATNQITPTFVGNSNNKSHVKAKGIINVTCGNGTCKAKLNIPFSL